MNRVWKSIMLAWALVQVTQGVYTLGSGNPQNLASLFFRSRMASKDPAVTMACFADYIVKSNDVSEAYSGSYNQCLVDAKSGREDIEKAMSYDRQNIANTSISVCKRLETCNNLTSTLSVFNCHADIGANNTKAVYSISGNASEFASVMQEKYRIIDLKNEQCCKSAERKYVEETAVVYRVLQDCLDGRVAPTTAVPVITTVAAPTTSVPVTSTAAASTSTTTTIATTTTTPAPTTSTTTNTTTDVPEVPPSTSANLEMSTGPSKFGAKQLAAQILDIFK